MNDASNDGNEATEGILADLSNLQQSVNTADSANGDVDESIREKLDHIAEAAGSLRLPEPDEDSDDSDDVVPEPKRSAPKKARDAVANRGLVFEAVRRRFQRRLTGLSQTHRRPRVLSGGVKRERFLGGRRRFE